MRWAVLGAVMALMIFSGSQRGDAKDNRTAGQPHALCPGFGDAAAWRLAADNPWWAVVDIRDMLNIFHPLSVSVTGNTAGASGSLTIPADWKPPFALRFYCADDYFADPANHKPGQLGTESYFEHRFKQVLIDEKVVWEQDVIDENLHSSPTTFTVDLTPHVVPGKPFTLTFRVLDKVASDVRNERDVRFIGGTWYSTGDGKTEEPPRFHTALWFADPVIGEQAAVAATPAGQRPHEEITAARHRARWPMPPRGHAAASPVSLRLVCPATIPAPGYPLTCGVPVPPGLLKRADRVRLIDSAGRDLPLQTRATGTWPDGTVRWLLLHTVAPAGSAAGTVFRLRLNETQPASPRPAVKVTSSAAGVVVDTGAVRLAMGADPGRLIDGVFLKGQTQPSVGPLVARMSARLAEGVTAIIATRSEVEVIERGPVMACVEARGSLNAANTAVGRFVCRVYAYAGLPTLKFEYRIFNDIKPEPYQGTADDPPLQVEGLALVAELPGERQAVAVGGDDPGAALRSTADKVALVQDTADTFTVTADGADAPVAQGNHAAGWVAAATARGGVHAAVWRFWQQFPKALRVGPDGLEIGLFAATPATPAYLPRFGEAKRHDVWLSLSPAPLSDQADAALGLLAQEPPRLIDGPWFCDSGGLDVLDPDFPQNQPRLRQWMADQYGDVSSAKVTGQFGIRNFGDMPYKGAQWLNGYWAMVQGSLNWGLVSGDERWMQRSFEIARHIADVDCVHLPPGRPDWEAWHGVTCALGADHSVHDGGALWAAFQIGESLLLHYWMTGDLDSREAGLANADYLLRSQAGLGATEARNQARPMLTLLRAWQVTGEPRYLEGAKRYLDLKYQRENVIEWRRGAYIQPTYENWRCISAGLDSMYARNIYEYYRLTGEPEAAQMVVAIADSVYAESMLPQEEGLGSFIFYPRYSRSSWYYTQMAILFSMAYDLTDDARFLRAGRAAFERYLLCEGSPGKPWHQPFHNFAWLDPECGGWLQQFKDVPTAPFHITTQTPVPDPANY